MYGTYIKKKKVLAATGPLKISLQNDCSKDAKKKIFF